MAFLDFIKGLVQRASPATTSPNNHTTTPKQLTYADKELLAVQRTTQADVSALTGFPYAWNTKIEKYIDPHAHPFVYMDIVGHNISVAEAELEKMNNFIIRDKSLCKKLPASLQIPINEIVFTRCATKGYSRLILSPITHDGKPTDSPVSLSFMSDMDRSNTSHGDIYYNAAGQFQKANLYFWRRGNGYFLYYDTVDGELVLSRVEDDSRSTIYKGQHLLDLEARRIQDERDYAWLQNNLPEQCPKSISSYRRMKTQNTKNYQTLKTLAADKGREI